MEPIELEVIMRDQTKEGFDGVVQNISDLEQTTASFVANYNRQIEVVRLFEAEIRSLKELLSGLPEGSLVSELNIELDIAKATLQEEKDALKDLEQTAQAVAAKGSSTGRDYLNATVQTINGMAGVVSAGLGVAQLLGVEKEKLVAIEAKLQALTALVDNVLDPLRELYGKPVRVSSGFRCERLNAAVGGASSSRHMKGEAADIYTGTKEGNKELFELIKKELPFDQLIDEKDFSWVHVSFREGHNRKQTLKL